MPAKSVFAEEMYETIELDVEMCVTDNLPSNDELFNQYAQKAFETDGESLDDESIQSTSYAKEYLNEEEQLIYTKVKDIVTSVANGESNSPVITIGNELLNNPTASVKNLVTFTKNAGQITRTVNEDALRSAANDLNKLAPNGRKIMEAIIKDCPFELYWYARVYRFGYGSISYSSNTIDTSSLADGQSMQVDGTITLVNYAAELYVDKNYADTASEQVDSGAYALADVSKTGSVRVAVNNANDIVLKHQSESDFDKLHSYKEEICELVSYNYDAPGNKETLGSDPWEMIYVFDGNPDTNVVCEGYSKAFQYLCEKSVFNGNVKVINASGDMKTLKDNGELIGGAHMWNIVNYQGVNYLVDVTNCDNVPSCPKGHEGLFMKGYKSGNTTDGYWIYCELPNGYVSHDSLYVYDANTLSLLGSTGDYITLSADDFNEEQNTIVNTGIGPIDSASRLLCASACGDNHIYIESLDDQNVTYLVFDQDGCYKEIVTEPKSTLKSLFNYGVSMNKGVYYRLNGAAYNKCPYDANQHSIYGTTCIHEYKFESRSDTITATCRKQNCGSEKKLKLVTPNTVDSSQTYNLAQLDNLDDFLSTTSAVISEADIVYYDITDDYNGTAITGAPSTAGRYKASISVEGQTATSTFSYGPVYRVTFNPNGVELYPEPSESDLTQEVYEGRCAYDIRLMAKEELEMVGWYTDAECRTPWDFDNDEVHSDITLYAKWRPLKHGPDKGQYDYNEDEHWEICLLYDYCLEKFNVEPHKYVNGKCVCGKTNGEPVNLAYMDSHSLTLGDDISINFYLRIPDGISSAYAVMECNGGTVTSSLNERASDGTYKVSYNLAAKDIVNDVVIHLYNEQNKPIPITNGKLTSSWGDIYSVDDYYEEILSGDAASGDTLEQLIKWLMVYGNCANAYFNNVPYTPSDALVADYLGSNSADISYSKVVNDSKDNSFKYVGSSLVLKSKTSIKHYFSLSDMDLSDIKICYENNEYTLDQVKDHPDLDYTLYPDNSLIAFTIKNIVAVDLNRSFDFAVKPGDDSTEGISVRYSALSYMYDTFYYNGKERAGISKELRSLMQAMYKYQELAEEYFR